LFVENLISMNALHEFLREAIEMKEAMKSSKSNILIICKMMYSRRRNSKFEFSSLDEP